MAGSKIAKWIAQSGLCSRREAERWIEAGRVRVDGQVMTNPALVLETPDGILVDLRPLPKKSRIKLWLYYKPIGLLCTHKDPQGRPTIFDALAFGKHVISVGRLDLNSEGLLLLTNDGALARTFELPKTGMVRTYRVRVHGKIDVKALESLRQGITIEGVRYGSIDVEVDRMGGANTWLYVKLTEGKNREIRKVMNHLDLQVNRLIRVSYGPFVLGNLKPGETKEIPLSEFAQFLETQ